VIIFPSTSAFILFDSSSLVVWARSLVRTHSFLATSPAQPTFFRKNTYLKNCNRLVCWDFGRGKQSRRELVKTPCYFSLSLNRQSPISSLTSPDLFLLLGKKERVVWIFYLRFLNINTTTMTTMIITTAPIAISISFDKANDVVCSLVVGEGCAIVVCGVAIGLIVG
jgi:hypothetical protein